MAKWEALVWKNRDNFEVARNVLRDSSSGRQADLSQALVDCFAGKASATLHSRVGPLLRYVHFMSREHSDPFPLDEGKLYMFMDRYCRTAAATFARSFLETLNFSKYVLGLDVPAAGISQRVQGVAKACYLDKRKLVQKPPLLVSHVQALEDIVLGVSKAKFSDYDRVCAGFFCFAVYARARYSDAQASASLQLDVLESESSYGFLEASVTRSKTSYSLERKTRYLPVIAPVLGVRSDAWGIVWHELLLKLGVTLREGWPLLPIPMQGGGFQQAPVSPEHAGRLLRELLRRELGDAESISALGTHSLKRFRPDATRSGYFVSEKLARGREPQDELDSSSCGSDDEEAPDYAEDELASDALARVKLLAGSSALGCVDKTRLHVFIADALMSICDVTYTRQVKKLNGVAIKGDTEPSEALVDFCVSIYEGNTLRFIPWEKCTSRLAEIQGDAKKDTRFTLDAQGKSLKLEAKPQDLQCAVDSEIHVMQALQRRALACDQANLIDYTILEEWHQRLMRARLQDVPPGYVRPSFKQLLRADQRLFAELQDRSRTGIQSDADGRPLDKLLPHVMDLTEVTMLMQPLPAPSASSTDVFEKPWVGTGKERLSPYGKVKDGKGKGKTKGKRTGVLPKALVGCYSCTASGENICYDFNINGCSRAVKNNRCERGIHICARCRQTGHNAANCPKKE
ncbi:unnamed protein product [Symbiodinium sp. KB8]|nr:unnamed protein product [Symbiodinium sp. KB8]